MDKSARSAVADRMVAEMLDFVMPQLAPGRRAREETWAAMVEPDEAMMNAVHAWERGEMTYATLEAEGTRYVEAWLAVNAAFQAEGERAV